MPTRLIDSTPPATAMSCWPDMTCAGGEVHRVEAGGAEAVDLDARHAVAVVRPSAPPRARCRRPPRRPDRRSRARRRRRARVSSPLRSLIARSACAASDSAVTSCSEPSGLPRPRGRADVVVDEGLGHRRLLGLVGAGVVPGVGRKASFPARSEQLGRQRHHRVGAGRDAREMRCRLRQHALHEEARRRRASRPWRRPSRAPRLLRQRRLGDPRPHVAHARRGRRGACSRWSRRRHCRVLSCAFCMNHMVACCRCAEPGRAACAKRLQRSSSGSSFR